MLWMQPIPNKTWQARGCRNHRGLGRRRIVLVPGAVLEDLILRDDPFLINRIVSAELLFSFSGDAHGILKGVLQAVVEGMKQLIAELHSNDSGGVGIRLSSVSRQAECFRIDLAPGANPIQGLLA